MDETTLRQQQEERCRDKRFGETLFRDFKTHMLQARGLTLEQFQAMSTQGAELIGITVAYYKALDWYASGEWAAALQEWQRIYETFGRLLPEESKPERVICINSMCLAATKLNRLDEARRYGEAALQLARETPCRNLEADVLGTLASVHRLTKRFDAGARCRQAAITIFRELHDVRGEAAELSGLGNIEHERGNLEEAISLQQQALGLARRAREYELIPTIMQNLEHSWATHIEQLKRRPSPRREHGPWWKRRRGERALERAIKAVSQRDWHGTEHWATEAFAIFQAIDEPVGMAAASDVLAGNYAEQGLWAQALEPIHLAVKIYREQNLMGGVEKGLANLFTVLTHLDDVATCISCLEERLDFAMMHGQRHEAGPILQSLGEYLRRVENHERAKYCQREAMAIFQSLGDTMGMALAADELAAIARYEGDFDEALDYSARALQLFQQVEDPEHIAIAWANRGQILLTLGDMASAAEHLVEAVLYFRSQPPGRNLIATLDSLGAICESEVMFAEAIQFLEEARTLARKLQRQDLVIRIEVKLIRLQIRSGGFPIERITDLLASTELTGSTRQETVGLLAWTLRIMGKAQEALPLLNKTVAASREQTNYSLHTQLLIERARVHMALGDEQSAEADYNGALILIEGIRSTIHASDDRIKYWSKVDSINIYDELVSLLWEKNGRAKDAFEVIERSKGRVFLELLGEAAGLYPKDDSLEIMSRLALTEYDLKDARSRLSNSTDAQQTNRIKEEIRYYQKNLDTALLDVEAKAPAYVSFRRGQPASFEAVRNLLA